MAHTPATPPYLQYCWAWFPRFQARPVPSELEAISNLNAACGGASVTGNSGNPACIDMQYVRGPFSGFGGYVSPDPIFDSQGSHPYDNKSKLDVWGTSLRLEWDLGDGLQLRSVTAYRKVDAFWPSNSDHSPNAGAEAKNDFDQNQLTQELQLLGTALDGRLDWIAGGYYLKEEGENLNVVHFPGVIFRSGGRFDTDSEAAFAQSSYDIVEDIELTAGLRYTQEHKSYDSADFQQIIGVLSDPFTQVFLDLRANPIPFITGTTPDIESNETTPYASIAWEVRPELMTYLSYSRGYKSGGYEQRVAPGTPSAPNFEPEFADVYELGFKSTADDDRFTLNGAWFYTDYTDMQISAVDGVAPTLINAGDSTIMGTEIEAWWRPQPELETSLIIGWMDAEYDRLSDRALSSGVRLNNDLPNTSEWQLGGSIAYDFPVSGRGTLTPRLDWSWRSEYFIDSANSPLLKQEAFHLLNASLSFVTQNENWEIVLSGRNLTDEAYLVSGLAQYNIGQIEGQYARPREWNLSLHRNF
jgi:iron complex outermembrane receptor protein